METAVGLFVILGVACLGWLSIRLGRWEPAGERGYRVHAVFGSVEGLPHGSTVEIAGVEIGRVERIELSDYRARVTMRVARRVRLQDDAIASIRTKGLVGEKFISITPGASRNYVSPGGTLHDTEDAINVEQLISNYIHGQIK
jgi:phospholipid/cholesterol/gamma-HCH transport system substrate-binding protein